MDEEEGTVWAEEPLTAALTEGSVAVGEEEPEPDDISSDSSLSVVVTDEAEAEERWPHISREDVVLAAFG